MEAVDKPPQLLVPVALVEAYLDALYAYMWRIDNWCCARTVTADESLARTLLYDALATATQQIVSALAGALQAALDAGRRIPMSKPYHRILTPNPDDDGPMTDFGPWIRCSEKLRLYQYCLFVGSAIHDFVGVRCSDPPSAFEEGGFLALQLDTDQPLREALASCIDDKEVVAAMVYNRHRSHEDTQALLEQLDVSVLPERPSVINHPACGEPCYDMLPLLDTMFNLGNWPHGSYGLQHSRNCGFIDLDVPGGVVHASGDSGSPKCTDDESGRIHAQPQERGRGRRGRGRGRRGRRRGQGTGRGKPTTSCAAD